MYVWNLCFSYSVNNTIFISIMNKKAKNINKHVYRKTRRNNKTKLNF